MDLTFSSAQNIKVEIGPSVFPLYGKVSHLGLEVEGARAGGPHSELGGITVPAGNHNAGERAGAVGEVCGGKQISFCEKLKEVI